MIMIRNLEIVLDSIELVRHKVPIEETVVRDQTEASEMQPRIQEQA